MRGSAPIPCPGPCYLEEVALDRHLAVGRRSQRVTMDITVPSLPPPSVEFAPRAAIREVTKEFVRRPAKGWTDATPVPVLRFDHHCDVLEQR